MSAARPDRRRLASRSTALLVALALPLGALLGRATAPSAPAPTAPRAPIAAPGGARGASGRNASFPETPAGAAAQLAAYERSFAGPSVLRRGVLRRRIEAAATPDYAARMLAANRPGLGRLAGGPIGVGLAHGLRTIYAAVPIGWRVEHHERGRARIETWGLTLLGNAGSVEPAAWFGLAHTELVWLDGRWRIAGTESGFGPTPRLATPPGPLGAYDVLDIAHRLHPYALAP